MEWIRSPQELPLTASKQTFLMAGLGIIHSFDLLCDALSRRMETVLSRELSGSEPLPGSSAGLRVSLCSSCTLYLLLEGGVW